MKKILVFILSFTLLVTVAVTGVYAEERPTIVWLLSNDNNAPEMTEIQQILCDQFNVDLQYIYVNSADADTKLNTLIAGDNLPDVFRVSGQTAVDLRDAGKLTDLTPYLEEYAPDYVKMWEDAGLGLDYLTLNVDGAVYALGTPRGGYISNLLARKDWLENLNMEVPTTIDELYEMLRAFRFDDPDGNGETDTYGFSAFTGEPKTWEHVFSAFGIPYNCNIEMEDGTITRFVKHPNYLKAVSFLNKLYHEDIMDPDFATITWVEYAEDLWNGRIGIFDFQSVGPANNWFPGRYTFGNVPENAQDLFVSINVANIDTGEPTGGVKLYPETNGGLVISAKCTCPERVLELVNYTLCTEEGQFLTYLGVEGKMYKWIDKENGKYERLGDYADDTYHRAAGCFIYSEGGGWTFENAESRTMNAFTQKTQSEELQYAIDHAFIPVILDSWSEYGTSIESVELEMLVNLIVSDGDLEAEYAAYMERWVEEGGEEFEKEATQYWETR